jgi:hypothetical protein
MSSGDERPRRDQQRPYVKRDGEQRSYPKRDGERRSYPKRDGEHRSYPKRDGERRPYEKRDGERKPYEKRDGERRPYEKRDGERRPYEKRDGERKPYEKRDSGRRPYEKRDGGRSSRPPQHDKRRSLPAGPSIPEEVAPQDLHPQARNELKTLSKENADEVARHLAMVADLIDDNPQLAHEHALAASRRAGRIAIVRETLAITAYATGDFALALRELRTYRRISGKDDQIALLVDSERGVGRPDRALEAGREVDRSKLPVETRVALAIAMSGARLDRGETELALSELDIPELNPDRAFMWSPALFLARAAVLEDLGRTDEATFWTERADAAAEALYAIDAEHDELIVDEIIEVALDEDTDEDAEEESDGVAVEEES